MSKNRWFKFFPSDFLTGVRNLNPIEITAYVIVLCELYDHEGSCRRDDEHMARVCRIRKGDFSRALDSLIAKGKVDVSSGMLSNKRVSEEISRRIIGAQTKAQQRRDGDMAATWPRHEQTEKGNKNKPPSRNVLPYKEERNKKNNTTPEVLALPPRDGLTPAEKAQLAMDGYRQRQRRRDGRLN